MGRTRATSAADFGPRVDQVKVAHFSIPQSRAKHFRDVTLATSVCSFILTVNTTPVVRRWRVLSLTPANVEISSLSLSSRQWSSPPVGTTTTTIMPFLLPNRPRRRCLVAMETDVPKWTAPSLIRGTRKECRDLGPEGRCLRRWLKEFSIFRPNWCGRKIRKRFRDTCVKNSNFPS